MPFENLALFYDDFYATKDYRKEVAFILDRLEAFGSKGKKLIDLGCGTGSHLLHFIERGYDAWGIDQSEEMVRLARNKLPLPDCKRRVSCQNLTSMQLDQEFDICVSLFHVFSYLPDTTSLRAALNRIFLHLRDGGLLLFDFWNGPGVLNTPPTTRVLERQIQGRKIIRIGEPRIDLSKRQVEVHYRVFTQELDQNFYTLFEEEHVMRYWFLEELEAALAAEGFRVLEGGEWLTTSPNLESVWSAYLIAQRKVLR